MYLYYDNFSLPNFGAGYHMRLDRPEYLISHGAPLPTATTEEFFTLFLLMLPRQEMYGNMEYKYHDALTEILELQNSSGVQIIRKEGELLFMIKQEPGRPVKFYMNKSGMSSRWFNEILKQLMAFELVKQEPCAQDARRKLLS